MPYERKIINDPVFGFINIPKGLLYDIVRHPLLQRLTRIKQVGLSSVVYPGAQHTRFQHSLGAFYLMSEAITQLASKGNFIFDSEAEAVQAAILLHDIGHGPFSHVLEVHHCQRSFSRRNLPYTHGTDEQGDERATQPCHSNLQGRISETFPASACKRATGYGQTRLSSTRQFLHRRNGREYRFGEESSKCSTWRTTASLSNRKASILLRIS